MKLAHALFAAALAATLPGIRAEAAPRLRIGIGPEVSVFLPSEGKTRDRFGATWFSIGVGFGRPEFQRTGVSIDPTFDIFWKTSGDDHAFAMPVGAEARYTFPAKGLWQPYVGTLLAATAVDIRSDADNAHSGLHAGAATGLFAGTRIGPQAWLEARYYAMTPVHGFGLSGLNLVAGIHF